MLLMEQVNQLIQKYEQSKRTDQYEPKWILPPFNDLYNFKKDGVEYLRSIYGDHLDDNELLKIFEDETVGALLTPDGTTVNSFPFPPRVIHDGFKVGTTSWVFMGRKDSPIVEIPHYYGSTCLAIRREIPSQIAAKLNKIHPELDNFVYAAYSMDEKLNLDVGPCLTFDQLVAASAGEAVGTIKVMRM